MLSRTLTRPLSRSLSRPITGWGGSIADFFVDSVNGSDSNDGLTADTPLQTLAAASSQAVAGDVIGFARGSSWRESLDLIAKAGAQITVYGTGNAPIIDGSTVVSSWAAEGTANVYQATVAHSTTGTNRCTVYEDGVLLTRVASVATCSSTPGSFVDIAGSAGTPWTVKIHATGSGNPASNGKTYEVAVRYGLEIPQNGKITGPLTTRKATGNNGSTSGVNRENCTIKKLLASAGTKHNFGIGSGLCEDVVAWLCDPPTSYELTNTMMVAYLDDCTGKTATMDRVMCIGSTAATVSSTAAYYAHSGGASKHASLTFRQVAAVGCSLVGAPIGEAVTWDGLFADRCNEWCGRSSGGNLTIRRALCRSAHATHSSFACIQTTGVTTDIEDLAFYSSATTTEMFRVGLSGTFQVNQAAFVVNRSGGRPVMVEVGPAASGTIQFRKTVFEGNASIFFHISVPNGWNYIGDYNVFRHSDANPFKSQYRGTQYNTLATWQTATGQDANSVYLAGADQVAGGANAFWLAYSQAAGGTALTTIGPAVGDFRINPNARVYSSAGTAFIGTFPDGTPITSAGPQTHWNWNGRASASGPPSAIPTLPATEAESSTYVANPSAWNFYP